MKYTEAQAAEIRKWVGDSEVVLSVSGGKDSTATALHFKDLGIHYRAVHMDTGWESRVTMDYLRDVLPTVVGPIHILRAQIELSPALEPIARMYETRLGVDNSPFVRRCLKYAAFPSRLRKWCTGDLKEAPMKRYLSQLSEELDCDIINAVGVRAEESPKRAAYPETEPAGQDVTLWRPILQWTLDDVQEIHRRHEVRPNPLYMVRGGQAISRVGCWPCINARKTEIAAWADLDPDRWSILRDLERTVADLKRAVLAEKGTTLEEKGHTAPTFFVNPAPTRRTVVESRPAANGGLDLFGNPAMETVERVVRGGECVSIDDVVQWARNDTESTLGLFASGSDAEVCRMQGWCE